MFGREWQYLLSMYLAKLKERSTRADVTGTWIKNLLQHAKVLLEVHFVEQICP